MSDGRIHVTLDPTIVSACESLAAQMELLLPFLVRLKPAEKNGLVRPHPGAQEVMQTIADLQRSAGMPPGDDDPMLADLSVYAGLTTVSTASPTCSSASRTPGCRPARGAGARAWSATASCARWSAAGPSSRPGSIASAPSSPAARIAGHRAASRTRPRNPPSSQTRAGERPSAGNTRGPAMTTPGPVRTNAWSRHDHAWSGQDQRLVPP